MQLQPEFITTQSISKESKKKKKERNWVQTTHTSALVLGHRKGRRAVAGYLSILNATSKYVSRTNASFDANLYDKHPQTDRNRCFPPSTEAHG